MEFKKRAGKGSPCCCGTELAGREHLHAVRRALSHRGGSVRALSERFLRRMLGKVSRAALQGRRERGSCMPMAPGAQLLRGGNSGALGPCLRPPLPPQLQLPAVCQRPCCHRDTRTLSHPWNHSQILGQAAGCFRVPQSPKGLVSHCLERFVLQECTPEKINTEVQCRTRAPSEILTPERAPLPRPSLQPAPHTKPHQATALLS